MIEANDNTNWIHYAEKKRSWIKYSDEETQTGKYSTFKTHTLTHSNDGAIHFILSLNSVSAPVFIFAAS